MIGNTLTRIVIVVGLLGSVFHKPLIEDINSSIVIKQFECCTLVSWCYRKSITPYSFALVLFEMFSILLSIERTCPDKLKGFAPGHVYPTLMACF